MRYFSNLTLLLLSMTITPLQAVTLQQGDYQGREDVAEFIQQLASRTDYTTDELVKLFSQVKKQSQLFERMNNPAEKLEWHQYRKIFLTDKRATRGAKFWNQHKKLLQSIEQRYQVPAEIIVAIVGVETFYGAYKGKAPVFDTLVTFAFDYPKRADFFLRELEQFLILSRENRLPVREIKGSYAGAMGMPQFISSSYRHYAVDFDGDKRANLFSSVPDILASVANYFVKHGWQAGKPVVFPLQRSSKKPVKTPIGIKPEHSWSDLQQEGFSAKQQPAAKEALALVRFGQKNHDEYWAGYKNFYVITRYNHSELYAMAVYQLSQKILQKMQTSDSSGQ